MQDTFRTAVQQGFKDVVGIIFSRELDFVTKLFIVLVFCSLIFLFTYLVLPMFLRRKIELFDYNPQGGGTFSSSAMLSFLILASLGIFKLQKQSLSKTEEEK